MGAGGRESWEKWAPQLLRAGENAAAVAADVQQCNVVLLVRCMTDNDGRAGDTCGERAHQ